MNVIKKLANERIFLNSFCWYVVLQYLLPYDFFSDVLFYGLLLPVFLWYFREKLFELVFQPRDILSLLIMIMVIYISIHSLIVKAFDLKALGILGIALSNYAFFLCAREFFARQKEPAQFIQLLTVAMLVSALFSIFDFLFNYDYNQQLRPWNTSNHVIAGANVCAIGLLFSMYLIYISKNGRDKFIYAIIGLTTIIVVVLARSRGALFALSCSSLLLGLLLFRWRFILGFAVAVILIGIVDFVNSGVVFAYVQSLFLRGDAGRLSIYQAVVEKVIEHPLIGYGMRANFTHLNAHHPHSLYLATAFYLGIPGLVMLLSINFLSFWAVFKSSAAKPYRFLVTALLAYGMLAVLTDSSRIIRAPSGLWLFYWMPIAMAASLNYLKRKQLR